MDKERKELLNRFLIQGVEIEWLRFRMSLIAVKFRTESYSQKGHELTSISGTSSLGFIEFNYSDIIDFNVTQDNINLLQP